MKSRHSRQSFLGDYSEQVLRESRIGIVGLCGGGSHVAQQLAHIGIGQIVISDFDHVDAPNLNRMVGSRPDDAESKRLKCDVIQEHILRINPNAEVRIAGRWQQSGDLIRTCNIVIGCVDSFAARDELEKFSRRFLIPYVDIGMDVHKVSCGYGISGQVALSISGGHCLWCHGILTQERLAQEERNYGAAGGKPQVIWPNGVLASIAVGHAISLLLPWNTELPMPSLIEYDGNRHVTRPGARLQFLKDVPCVHYKGEGLVGNPFFSVCNMSAVSIAVD